MSNALKDWLDGFGLGRCAGILAAHEVDFDVLPDLVEHDLEKIGLPLGERKRLLRAIGTLGEPSHTAPAAAAASGPERRRLTVMFCDLVGSTELAARLDPEDFHTVVAAHLAAIADGVGEYAGFVARYYGDGLLAYFGWPRASDNDAELAASGALAVLARVAACDAQERMRVRVGVATGLVVVGDIVGQGSAREFVVSGETPNLAARLQAAAEPGTALLAAETLRARRRCLHLRREAVAHAQGLRALGRSLAAGRRARGRTPHAARVAWGDSRIVGREQELDWLLARWREAIDGTGRVSCWWASQASARAPLPKRWPTALRNAMRCCACNACSAAPTARSIRSRCCCGRWRGSSRRTATGSGAPSWPCCWRTTRSRRAGPTRPGSRCWRACSICPARISRRYIPTRGH